MDTTAQMLREKLSDLFESVTEEITVQTCLPTVKEPSAEERASMERLRTETLSLTQGVLREGTPVFAPTPMFYDALDCFLRYRVYALHESWHVRKDVTDEELLASAPAIEARDLEALRVFRDESEKIDYFMRFDDTYALYQMHVNNLSYLFYALAHLARHLDARETGILCLRLQSVFTKAYKDRLLRFKDDQIDDIVSDVRTAFEGISVAIDFARLTDWESFRPKEAERLAAEVAHAAQVNQDGGASA